MQHGIQRAQQRVVGLRGMTYGEHLEVVNMGLHDFRLLKLGQQQQPVPESIRIVPTDLLQEPIELIPEDCQIRFASKLHMVEILVRVMVCHRAGYLHIFPDVMHNLS